ncbi:DsbA family oxidoreductase [Actinomadura rayongensis]|uniref:DsbA family oxidoreductase n=1 Tax=Actinomadura rayongensis TaxID=1429076 RepID=UPI00192911B7|nr:DsbA family protein [Actinomadura rayongensis]
MDVEITLDVICSWSYVGFTRFRRAADRARAEGRDVTTRFRPFELAPGAPTDGVPLLDAIRFAFGDHGVEATARVIPIAAAEGLVLNYEKGIATGTFDAHRLIAQADAQGLGEDMVERLFRAHFTDGLHVGDPDTLARLAAEVGVVWDGAAGTGELRAALDKVRDEGVRGVPMFAFAGGPTLTGAVGEGDLSAALAA